MDTDLRPVLPSVRVPALVLLSPDAYGGDHPGPKRPASWSGIFPGRNWRSCLGRMDLFGLATRLLSCIRSIRFWALWMSSD